MPRRKELTSNVNADLISMQLYHSSFGNRAFDPHQEFEKWAAVEVSDHDNIPEEMEAFTLQEGLYAVFHYNGLSTDNSIFQYIFTTWLPLSGYSLDNRPQFEVLGARYKNNDPDSEEEIWIPIRSKID